VVAIGVQLAEALAHAHAAGVVHRDLKPGNVLLDADDRVTLTDFGIARLMSETTRHTATGVTLGTAAYLAPEQVRGEEVTPASDVYSLGLLLLEALTGERAYQGLPVEAALARLTTPPNIPDTVPSPWHELLRAMTALDPTDRPSAGQVAASLRDLTCGSEPAPAVSRVGRVHDDGLNQLTSRARYDHETVGIWGLEPQMRWRGRALVGFAVLLMMMLVSTSVARVGSGEHSGSPVSTPQGSATVPAERHEIGFNTERGGPVAALSGLLPTQLGSASVSLRSATTRDRQPDPDLDPQTAGDQLIGQRDGQTLDGSRDPVDERRGKRKPDELEKKDEKDRKDKKTKAAA
jgi:serine/threonine protein kinase